MSERLEKLALGTAQFGLAYGISNSRGRSPRSDVDEILELAASHRVTLLDTAPMYGRAESVLGSITGASNMSVVTKTPHLSGDWRDQVAQLRSAFARSLERLQRQQLYGLLVHRTSDLLGAAGAALWEEMLSFQEQGLVLKLGVSVYDKAELELALAHFNVEIVQLPVSLIDQRMLPVVDSIKAQGIEVHARSILAQGLLFMPVDKLPGHFQPYKGRLMEFHRRLSEMGVSPLEASLNFAVENRSIDRFIIGVESPQQLREVIDALSRRHDHDWSCLAINEPQLVDPRNWGR